MCIVTIIYPTDPLGIVPGGTDTCIRDILKCAPDDIKIRLIGVTTDKKDRPLKQWTVCELSGRKFDFFPVLAVNDLRKQMKIPLSLKFTLGLIGSSAWKGADILQFHRLEPALLYFNKQIPRVTVIHQNMKVIGENGSDIRWKYFPNAYFKMEDIVLPRFDEIRIVREDAVKDYQARFPLQKDHIKFLPTWMNPDLFYYPDLTERSLIRREILNYCGWSEDSILMISVGRLDLQKDPILALEVLNILLIKYPTLKFIIIGDGVLEKDVESKLASLRLESSVKMLGAQKQDKVAHTLKGCDLMLLTSAYEGMPRCVVESLGCGVPVTSTDVGEVKLLIQPGKNGTIALNRTHDELANAASYCIENIEHFKGKPCTKAVEKYSAKIVLEDLYSCYRNLSK